MNNCGSEVKAGCLLEVRCKLEPFLQGVHVNREYAACLLVGGGVLAGEHDAIQS